MNHSQHKSIDIFTFKSFPTHGLIHFSTTTHGGVSTGNYGSMNLGKYCGDDPEMVAHNWERLSEVMQIPLASFYSAYQSHEDKIMIIDADFVALSDSEKINRLNGIDALITNQKNVAIGVTTADCVPILIYDSERKILAAIHAGWRGTVAHIVAKTTQKMIDIFGCDVHKLIVGIAPSISPEAFEVGEEVGESFRKEGFDMSTISYRHPQSGKLHIDLWEANRLQLMEMGVLNENIEVSRICTFKNEESFFSARRQTIHSGRMVTGGAMLE